MCVAPYLLPKFQTFAPFVAHTVAPVLTTSVQEPAEDDGSSHSGMACPDRGFFLPISKPPIAQSLAPMAVMAGQSSGGPTGDDCLTVCLCDVAAGKRHRT